MWKAIYGVVNAGVLNRMSGQRCGCLYDCSRSVGWMMRVSAELDDAFSKGDFIHYIVICHPTPDRCPSMATRSAAVRMSPVGISICSDRTAISTKGWKRCCPGAEGRKSRRVIGRSRPNFSRSAGFDSSY